MANSKDVKTLSIRLANNDYELQQLKILAKKHEAKLSSLIKYVMLCNILDQSPKCIAKVCPCEEVKPTPIVISITKTESNGVLFNWVQECQDNNLKNISRYIKNLVKMAIVTCNTNDEEEITDIYWDYIRLEELNRANTLMKIPKQISEQFSTTPTDPTTQPPTLMSDTAIQVNPTNVSNSVSNTNDILTVQSPAAQTIVKDKPSIAPSVTSANVNDKVENVKTENSESQNDIVRKRVSSFTMNAATNFLKKKEST